MLKFSASLLYFAAQAYGLGRDLATCWKVAALFDNTCPKGTLINTYADPSLIPSATVSCTGSLMCPCTGAACPLGGTKPVTYTASSPCKWERQLCVTCD